MAMQLPQDHAPSSPLIPDRLYFKIGDVARICGVETYVLRFWQTQFPQLKPNKSGTGQRLYRRNDVELVLKIKQLVHTEGYTLSGARQALEQAHSRKSPPPQAKIDSKPILLEPPAVSAQSSQNAAATIAHACAELREIAGLLAAPQPQSPAPPPPRRRARVTAMPPKSDTLFPL
jgi:DNA-binding transcriptional MerR regulator